MESHVSSFVAIDNGYMDVCKYLVLQGANIHDQDNQGKSCLMVAAESGHLDICMLLLDNEVGMEPGDGHSTCLMNAIEDY